MEGEFGNMVVFKDNEISTASLKDSTRENKNVNPSSYLVKAARGVGISFGD